MQLANMIHHKELSFFIKTGFQEPSEEQTAPSTLQ
jgi:hypothetical protein